MEFNNAGNWQLCRKICETFNFETFGTTRHDEKVQRQQETEEANFMFDNPSKETSFMVYKSAEQKNVILPIQEKCISSQTFRTSRLDEEIQKQQKTESTNFTLKTS